MVGISRTRQDNPNVENFGRTYFVTMTLQDMEPYLSNFLCIKAVKSSKATSFWHCEIGPDLKIMMLVYDDHSTYNERRSACETAFEFALLSF